MKNKLIEDIRRYIDYLSGLGLYITVHGEGGRSLEEYNIHKNPFCSLVKTDEAAWQKCIRCQKKVFHQHKSGSLFGMCHAGMEEYVFFVNDRTFVSVSGYGIDREKALKRIKRLAQTFILDEESLVHVYDSSLKHEPEDEEVLQAVIRPLCCMLYLLQVLLADVPAIQSGHKALDAMMAYVQKNFMENISVRDIAQACCYSESAVSHIFRKYTGKPVKKYIMELRLEQAKKLLGNSELPIGEVAMLCGFSNINYFPTVFKEHIGVAPSVYRQQQKQNGLQRS